MNRKLLVNIDLGLISCAIVLVIISLTTLFSIDQELFKSQFLFFLLGIFAFLLFSQVNYKALKIYAIPVYIISIILLFIVLVVGIESRGSVRWIEFLGFRVQFSEILKPFLAISLASFLSFRNNYFFRTLFLGVCFLAPIVFLVFLQPDLGNALIFFFVSILTFLVFGFPLRFFLAGLISVIGLFPILWNFLHNYQKERILSFLNPKDPLGLSYNAIQSVIAVGSGMLIGRGLGSGTQSGLRFLPERHTDFIFAALSEELGIVGAVLVVLSLAFLLYKIFLIFLNQEDLFCKLFALISFSLIFFQFFINIGMNIGIIPIVGITLPFISYGGSSLLSNFILLGILSAMSSNTSPKRTLEIK